MPCCDNPELYCDIDDYVICQNCYAVDMEASQTRIEEQVYNETGYLCNYSDRKYYSVRYMGYKVKHHISEMLKRIECDEPNKPTNLDHIKTTLKGDYTLANIWKVCNRKHMIYIFCKLNGLQPPLIPTDIKERIQQSIIRMSYNYKKLPNYIYIIMRICEKYDHQDLKRYLYVKSKKKKLDEWVDKYI